MPGQCENIPEEHRYHIRWFTTHRQLSSRKPFPIFCIPSHRLLMEAAACHQHSACAGAKQQQPDLQLNAAYGFRTIFSLHANYSSGKSATAGASCPSRPPIRESSVPAADSVDP